MLRIVPPASRRHREETMPFVNIRLVKEVIASDPQTKKGEITKGVVEAIVRATGLTSEDVWVVFEEVAARDWYVGPTSVERRRAK
jgi:4-oxalocrotonate tautomerase